MSELALMSSRRARLRATGAGGRSRRHGGLASARGSRPPSCRRSRSASPSSASSPVRSAAPRSVAIWRHFWPSSDCRRPRPPTRWASRRWSWCVTYLSLIVGELVPKRLALADPERAASQGGTHVRSRSARLGGAGSLDPALLDQRWSCACSGSTGGAWLAGDRGRDQGTHGRGCPGRDRAARRARADRGRDADRRPAGPLDHDAPGQRSSGSTSHADGRRKFAPRSWPARTAAIRSAAAGSTMSSVSSMSRQLAERLLAGRPLDLAGPGRGAGAWCTEGTSVVRLVELFRQVGLAPDRRPRRVRRRRGHRDARRRAWLQSPGN